MLKLNSKVAGKIWVPDVLEFAVQKLRDSDIDEIQETYYTPAEKIELTLLRLNENREGPPLTKEQLLASMLSAYQAQQTPKSAKGSSKRESEKLPV